MDLRVAIACSGLGHIHRGVESWAKDLAEGLHHAGANVTLFGAGEPNHAWESKVRCWRRTGAAARASSAVLRQLGGWRCGLGSPYDIEQTTFSFHLWRTIRSGYDVLHVQDGWIASHLSKLHSRGLSRPRVILGLGTGGTAKQRPECRYIQHLTPAQTGPSEQAPGQRGFLIPNFIDTSIYKPTGRAQARRQWDLPEDAFIVLAVGAVRKKFKRIDYLIREFHSFQNQCRRPVILVVAGGREPDTDELAALGNDLLGSRFRLLINVPRTAMPGLYAAADLMTIPALDEVFGIAFIEAMACATPVLAHDTPTMRWVCGPAGLYADLRDAGGLAEALRAASAEGVLEPLRAGVASHVEANFSTRSVIPRMIEMYREVASA